MQRRIERRLGQGLAPLPACLAAAFAAGLAATAMMAPAPRLVWNASSSVPLGLYGLEPGRDTARRGDMVALRPPENAARLAAMRGYLPPGVPLLKRVTAQHGDRVCATGRSILVNGQVAAQRRRADGSGRPMPWPEGCTTLAAGEVLVLGDAAGSFDSRYFGPVDRSAIVGRAMPLWIY